MRTDKHISKIFGAEVAGRGPPRTPGKTARQANRRDERIWGEKDAIDFKNTDCQIFSTTDFEQAYERTAAEEKRKI